MGSKLNGIWFTLIYCKSVKPTGLSIQLFYCDIHYFSPFVCWNITVDAFDYTLILNVELAQWNNIVDLARENIKITIKSTQIDFMYVRYTVISPKFNELAWLKSQALIMMLCFVLYVPFAFVFLSLSLFCWCLWFDLIFFMFIHQFITISHNKYSNLLRQKKELFAEPNCCLWFLALYPLDALA